MKNPKHKTNSTCERIGRDQFAKISEVDGVRLDDEMKRMFEEFDRQNLSSEERRRAIIRRFKRTEAS